MAYDLIVLAILVLATIRGAVKGFVWQLASIAALILCFAFAETFSLAVAPHIAVAQPLNRWIAMAVLYVLFALLSFGVARLLHAWIEKAKFVEFDRHLGSIFGFLKGGVIALVLTFFVVTLSQTARAHVMQSRSGYLAAIIMDRLHPVMPAELHDVLEPYIHRLDQPGMDLQHSHHADDANASGPDADDHSHLPDDPFFPSQGSGGPEFDGPLAGVSALLDKIASIYADTPEARETILEDVQSATSGIPDEIVQAALADWHADLVLAETDPDPETDVATPLDARIARQLQAAGVPIDALSRAVRDRLEDVLMR